MHNSIGIEKKEAELLVNELNLLLSNFQVYYQNLRGFHWNLKGENFFSLHEKFEEYYNDAQEKIDMIAERILTLDGIPFHTFETYLKHNKIKIAENVHQDKKAIESTLESLSIIISLERKILELSAEAKDEGTNSMISDFVAEQEKTTWMLKSWLK